MQVLTSMHINPAVLDALTDEEKAAHGGAHGAFHRGAQEVRRAGLLPVRAHLLEKAGDPDAACEHYRRAARATASLAEQRYLESRAGGVRRA